MGANSALQLYYRIFFLLAVGHAAVINSSENIAPLSDDVCSCKLPAECVALPENDSSPPCADPRKVRCCGVSSSVKNQEFSDTERKKFPKTSSKYAEEEGAYYDDYLSYEDESDDEGVTGVEKGVEESENFGELSPASHVTVEKSHEVELSPAKTSKGENIDDPIISQTDAFVSPDYLDYRTVNKYGVKGGAQTITGSEQRGKITSGKGLETSDKKTEGIVAEEVKEEEEAVFEQPESGQQKATPSEPRDSSASDEQKESAKTPSTEASNIEENNVAVGNEPTITIEELERAINSRGKSEHGIRARVPHQQRISGSVTREPVTVEENTERVTSTAAGEQQQQNVGRRRRPVQKAFQKTAHTSGVETGLGSRARNVYGHRKQPASRQQNEENASLNTGNQLDRDSSPEMIATTWRPAPEVRRPTSSRGTGRVYGHRKQTIPQQQSETVKKDAEESTSSNAQDNTVNDASLEVQVDTSSHETAGRKESKTVKTESPNLEAKIVSNVLTVISNAEEPTHDDTVSKHVGADESADGHRGETNSGEEKSEMITTERINMEEENTFADVNQATVTDKTTSNVETNESMNEADQNQSAIVDTEQTETTTEKNMETVSIESANMREENASSSSDLWDLVSGKQPPNREANPNFTETQEINANMDREVDANGWVVANRTYIPVLINAGYLRDRAMADGTDRPNPLFGENQGDIRHLEFLPLSCGSVVFGERFKDGKTLVCNVPKDDASPIRLFGGDDEGVNSGKPEAPITPLDTMHEEVKTRAATDDDVMHIAESANRGLEDSMVTKPEESQQTVAKSDRRMPPRNSLRVRQPLRVSAEKRREEEPMGIRKPARRGRVRHSMLRRQPLPKVDRIGTAEEDEAAVGQSQVPKATLLKTRSVPGQENSPISEWDVPSAEEYDAAKETEKRSSRSRPIHSDARDGGEPEVDEEAAAGARSKVSKKTSRNYSFGKKLLPKKTSDANVEELTRSADLRSGREAFSNNRNSRQAMEFAPEKKGVTISPEQLSMTGKISVVGLIPAGFKDPAICEDDELAMELPEHSFRASPVDPINWP